MNKKLKIIIIAIICLMVWYIFLNNLKFKNIEIIKSNNVPNYILINRSQTDDSGTLNYDSNILVTNKIEEYQKLSEQSFNNIEYNPYNDTLNFISNHKCTVNVYHNNLNAKEYDLCEKLSLKSGIQELRFTKNYNVATLNGGFRNDMKNYQSGIGIYDKEFKLIDELKINNIIYSTVVENDKIYYLISGENVQNEESQKKSQIVKYNIKSKKESIIYNVTKKKNIIDIIINNNNIYVIYLDNKDNNYYLGIIKNRNIIKKKKIGYEYGSFTNYVVNKKGDILVVFPTLENEIEEGKSSLVKIDKSGEIQIQNLVFPEAVLTASTDYIYYKDSNNKYYRMNTISLKKEEITIPFPANINQDNHFIYFFKK
ncbi:hypothetical protein [Mycoplasma sp. P36-A1]|uniref:hypothetical protein n=1 Tax=Mycoplasma sp. P36-A1 TaxID=3252900 RepID=UPI003C2E4767